MVENHTEALAFENFCEVLLSLGFIENNRFSLSTILEGKVLIQELKNIHQMVVKKWERFSEYIDLLQLELARSKRYADVALSQKLYFLRNHLEKAMVHENIGIEVACYQNILSTIQHYEQTFALRQGNISEDYCTVLFNNYERLVTEQ
eukprot:Sdes_comp23561_c0_seq1m21769